MKSNRTWLTVWVIAASAVLTALTLTTVTYAWFSANREVQTGRVTSRTESDQLELQISSRGGEDFTPTQNEGQNEAPLKPLDKPLIPVSTVDLATFVYCPATVGDAAEQFLPTKDETYYYYDTIYLKAAAQGMAEGTRMALYLDSGETAIVQAEEGELLTAARLGLTFDGADPVIIALSDVNEGPGNTSPGGVPMETGQVLAYREGQVVPTADPAIALGEAQIPTEGGSETKPIAYLELNRVYAVDIYFYLEGCDPDCLSERVAGDAATLMLAFFGLLAESEGGA